MNISLNSQCLAVLQVIIDSNNAITVEDISRMLNMSKRSVYYSLKTINGSLKKNKLEEITTLRNKGIVITSTFRDTLRAIIKSNRDVPISIYNMSTPERMALIICCIYINANYYTIEKLAEVSNVSRSTIQKDLKNVKSVLSNYGLLLAYSVNSGFQINGNNFMIRAIFLYYLNAIYYLINDDKIQVDWIKQSKDQYKKLKLIEKELNILYVTTMLEKLSVLIEYFKNDLKQEDLNIDAEILNSNEFALVSKHFNNVTSIERQYITLYLISGRSQSINEYKISKIEYPVIKRLAIKMIEKFEQIVCVEFDNKEKLVKNIMHHIICSVNRYKYGWLEVNELRDQIIEQYPEYYYFSELVVNSLESEFSYPITRDEIAYFALHFGAHIRNYGYKHTKLRIILVCPNGISTTSMLVKEIEELNLDLEVLDIVSIDKLRDYDKKPDLIISTVTVTSKFPVLKVHPILTSIDKNRIFSYAISHMEKKFLYSDLLSLMNKLDKYILKNKKVYVQEILSNYLEYKNTSYQRNKSNNLISLKELIDKEVITISYDDMPWEKAVLLCGMPLLKNNDILIDYINKTIQYIKNEGPYSVFPNQMLLAHAKCEDGVKNLSIAILISKKGILFSNDIRIKFIVLLATPDNNSHLRTLNELVEIFSDNQFAEEMEKSVSIDKICELIQNFQFKSYATMEENRDGI